MMVTLFPLDARHGRIRDVALKLASKPTARAARYYHSQVEQSFRSQFDTIGLNEADQFRELHCFWSRVRVELFRLGAHGNPAGTAG